MDKNSMNELIALFNQSGLKELELEENGTRIRLESHPQAMLSGNASGIPSVPPAPAQETSQAAPTPETVPATEPQSTVDSPMVGVFYPREKLGMKPLAPGEAIEPDTVVCAVEAMKMMCEIRAEKSGTYKETLISEGAAVEFGTPLIALD